MAPDGLVVDTGDVTDPRFFRMTSRWRLQYPRARVFEVLADGEAYPDWWPQVREAIGVDERSGTARLRSLVPMSLRVTLAEQVRDAERGELRAGLAGDLEGWSRWQISDDVHGLSATVDFTQEVLLRKNFPAWIIIVGRPVLWLNHRYMMWAGRRGLQRHLGGR